jgi:hypothetical protein
MSDFTKILVTSRGTCQFVFSKVEGASPKFFVQVQDHTTSLAAFDIKQNKDGKWKVVEPAPNFILIQEETLVKAIEQFLHESPTLERKLNETNSSL